MLKHSFSRLTGLLLALTLLLSGCGATVDIPIEDIANTVDTIGSIYDSLQESTQDPFFSSAPSDSSTSTSTTGENSVEIITLDSIPTYSGEPYCILNDNNPEFTEEDITDQSYEWYSELDTLGRCGVVMACVGQDLTPTEPRESISHVKPTGWVNVPYDFVDGKYLYNRCHLIGFQLTGENDNECNLITGTRYMNVDGMLPFENMIADYVKETNEHVLYRVTPLFTGDELVARGVQMEAWSVEDEGESICFNVYVYNVQPGVIIDYATGESTLDESTVNQANTSDSSTTNQGEVMDYVLNTNSHKFHLPSCSGAKNISEKNRQDYTGTRDQLIAQGYEACSQCNP